MNPVKNIVVTGGVLSGLGKGIVTCSIGKCLQVRGFKINVIKIDPYLNLDAGTMNPYIHGEVFVLDDGYEADMDLGNYERFLDLSLSRINNITTGQVYLEVIKRERRGDYLGKCVQIIPHITNEIKRRIRLVERKSRPDVLIIEVGGTVGDIEGLPFLEALRQLALKKGHDNMMFVHVTLVPTLSTTGEQKTKPTQHSVQELRRIGIQPDIIICRSTKPLRKGAREKIALFCNVDIECIFSLPDLDVIYEAPLYLDQQGLGETVLRRLKLEPRKPDWSSWRKIVDGFKNTVDTITVGLCGKYAELKDAYVSLIEALKHAAAYRRVAVDIKLIPSDRIEQGKLSIDVLDRFDGVVVPGGFGERGAEGKIEAIKYCRENEKPFLGLCFGFQLAAVEYARNVAKLEGAHSEEIDPDAKHLVITLLQEQKQLKEKGGTMRLGLHKISIVKGTRLYSIYGREEIYERHRHRYGLNNEYRALLEKHGLVFSAFSEHGEIVEALEIPSHPYFIATQYHPEFISRPGKPEPVFLGFINTILRLKNASRS